MILPAVIAPVAVQGAIMINEICGEDMVENPRDLKYEERIRVKEDPLRDMGALSARRVADNPNDNHRRPVDRVPRYEKKTGTAAGELSLDIFNSSDEEFLTKEQQESDEELFKTPKKISMGDLEYIVRTRTMIEDTMNDGKPRHSNDLQKA